MNFFLNGNKLSGPDSTAFVRVTELENGDIISVRGAFGECYTASNVSLNFQVTKLNLELISNPGNLLCEGDPVTLNASGADTYEFFINDQSQAASSSNASLSLNSLQDGDRAGFAGTNLASGCVQRLEDEVYFRIIENANINPQGPIAICEGEELFLKTQAQGQLQWYLDGGKLEGERGDSIRVQTSGTYTIAQVQGGLDEIWTAGKNSQGQLGDSSTVDRLYLDPASGNEIITAIDAGREFNLAATLDGRVFAWGDNSFGQLGDGSFVDRTAPKEVQTLTGARQVSAGDLHSLVLTQAGKIFAFGDNRAGQLGLGNNSVSSFPFEITSLSNIQRIESGANHSLAINNLGELFSWGENQNGQLGDGSNINKNAPLQLTGLPAMKDLAAGQNHSLALTNAGQVYVWGSNARGQLGLDTLAFSYLPVQLDLPEPIADVAAGAVHSLFLGESGTLYLTGGNDQGQLGLGNLIDVFVPIELKGLPNGKAVYSGDFQSFIQLIDNSIYGWGRNVSGSLGNGDSVQVNQPVYLPLLTGAGELSGGQDHLLVRMDYGIACESEGVEVEFKSAPEVSITEDQQMLTAEPAGVAYQWYVNGLPLLNDTSRTITPVIGGDYSVEVSFANGCSRLSDTYNFIPVGIEAAKEDKLSIYPNPTSGILTLETSHEITAITLYDAFGKQILKENQIQAQQKIMLNLEKLPKGTYTLEVLVSEKERFWYKVLLVP